MKKEYVEYFRINALYSKKLKAKIMEMIVVIDVPIMLNFCFFVIIFSCCNNDVSAITGKEKHFNHSYFDFSHCKELKI